MMKTLISEKGRLYTIHNRHKEASTAVIGGFVFIENNFQKPLAD